MEVNVFGEDLEILIQAGKGKDVTHPGVTLKSRTTSMYQGGNDINSVYLW